MGVFAGGEVTNTLSQFIQSDNYCCDKLGFLNVCADMNIGMYPCNFRCYLLLLEKNKRENIKKNN